MESQDLSLTELIRDLDAVFPSLADPELRRRPRREWVAAGLRTLPLLVPHDVVTVLPFVLKDVAESATDGLSEYGDMVIYFLDVPRGGMEPDDPQIAAATEALTDDEVAHSDREERIRAMLTPLPNQTSLSDSDQQALDRVTREESFSELTREQSRAIFEWLRYIGGIPNWDLGRCASELASATAYWRARSHTKTDPNGM
jgi:hypothetical protein